MRLPDSRQADILDSLTSEWQDGADLPNEGFPRFSLYSVLAKMCLHGWTQMTQNRRASDKKRVKYYRLTEKGTLVLATYRAAASPEAVE